jgi:hypothetical protein
MNVTTGRQKPFPGDTGATSPFASTLPEIADWPKFRGFGFIPGFGARKTERPGEIAGPLKGTELALK